MRKAFILLALLFATSCLLLTIYSFSQVDLNLTLSTNPAYQFFQSRLTNLGYFHRSLSTSIYLAIISLLTLGYWLLTKSTSQPAITIRQLWLIIGLAVVILLPAYPAFSHDVFNYMFDARIVTKYGLSPWQYKALDFPGDLWTRFMRWTHRPSVYPPIWIGISLGPSVLGFGKFTLTLALFKILAAAAYLGACQLIYQISRQLFKNQPSSHLTSLALFAFNPLVIIESLVNAHMEIVMIFFGLLAINLSLRQKNLLKWLSYLASVGIKFMTVFIGLVLFKSQQYLRQSVWLGVIISLAFIAWYGFQPWYVLWVLPFSLLLRPSWEKQVLILVSLAAPFWNIPLIYLGDFDLPNLETRLVYVIIPLLAGISLLAINRVVRLQK